LEVSGPPLAEIELLLLPGTVAKNAVKQSLKANALAEQWSMRR